jgi:hypothetical protein
MDEWTFDSIPFVWQRTQADGHPALPRWKRQPRLVERELLDTGDADIARIGYKAWRISGRVLLTDVTAAAFEARNGESATLSDGTTSWTAVLTFDGDTLVPQGAGVVGQASFVRPRG